MPEVLPKHAPVPIAVIGWDGAAYRVFALDATGRLNVNVLANLGLDDALQSVATDRLIVRGEDQLHSFKAALGVRTSGVVSGANGYFDSAPGGAGYVWVVTSVAAKDATSPCTAIEMLTRVGASNFRFSNTMIALPANQWFTIQCEKWLDPTDLIRIYFRGSLAGDSCEVEITGHYFTLEA